MSEDIFAHGHGPGFKVLKKTAYVLDEQQATAAASSGELLVLATMVNIDSMHDGIVLGGLTLDEDVQRIVAENDVIVQFGGNRLIGFSLGGMYVRYAAAKLYNEKTGLIAGLLGR